VAITKEELLRTLQDWLLAVERNKLYGQMIVNAQAGEVQTIRLELTFKDVTGGVQVITLGEKDIA
jgi:hypothetical protein